ncbi:hypothetical protein BH09BAC2_BH09BAC2_14550 [soil metagenome]
MPVSDANSTLKRLRSRYRLAVMNEDTFEEVIAFRLTRVSVYIALSTLFVLLVGLTVALIAFTPLKLYIPGYGNVNEARKIISLKVKADSIEQTLVLKEQYLNDLQKVLSGKIAEKDTTPLKMKEIPKSTY